MKYRVMAGARSLDNGDWLPSSTIEDRYIYANSAVEAAEVVAKWILLSTRVTVQPSIVRAESTCDSEDTADVDMGELRKLALSKADRERANEYWRKYSC